MLTENQLQQIALNEIMGRNVLEHFMKKHKQDLKLTHGSDVKVLEHWDVCLLSAHTLPMITELKVNYWKSYNTGYTAVIKTKKMYELLELARTDKAKEKGTQPYIIFFHFNSTWIVNISKLFKAYSNDEPEIKIIQRYEDDTTAFSSKKKLNTYLEFPLAEFGEYFIGGFNYRELRKQSLQQARQLFGDPLLKWEDEKHKWIDEF